MSERENILELKNVVYSFHTYGGEVKAVRDVSYEVRQGEILGIVGESGCGKSVTAQCILRLNPEPPGFFEGGEILYKGQDVLKMSKKEIRKIRGRELRIDTNARNVAARAMYKKLGYKEIGIVPTVFNGIPDVQLVLLEKYLG